MSRNGPLVVAALPFVLAGALGMPRSNAFAPTRIVELRTEMT